MNLHGPAKLGPSNWLHLGRRYIDQILGWTTCCVEGDCDGFLDEDDCGTALGGLAGCPA